MASTHYFPTDQVHFTWDDGHAPALTVAPGDNSQTLHLQNSAPVLTAGF